MLAKNPRAPQGIWFSAVSFTTFESKLAPTEGGVSILKPDRAFLRSFQLSQFFHHLRPGPTQGQAAILA